MESAARKRFNKGRLQVITLWGLLFTAIPYGLVILAALWKKAEFGVLLDPVRSLSVGTLCKCAYIPMIVTFGRLAAAGRARDGSASSGQDN